MTDATDSNNSMMSLQKSRIEAVIRLTQENAMVLSLAQRVGGKEIEAMGLEQSAPGAPEAEQVASDLSALRLLLRHHEGVVLEMEATLSRLDARIAAMCQA